MALSPSWLHSWILTILRHGCRIMALCRPLATKHLVAPWADWPLRLLVLDSILRSPVGVMSVLLGCTWDFLSVAGYGLVENLPCKPCSLSEPFTGGFPNGMHYLGIEQFGDVQPLPMA